MSTTNYRWKLLFLVVATFMLILAIPTMAISVLSKEISLDLELSLVQMGVVWGGAALLGIFTSFLSGAIVDKIGTKKIFIFGSLVTSLIGAARGFTFDFVSLTICVFMIGAFTPLILNSGYKISGLWFPSEKLGLANGIISMGMALGFLLGSFLSATFLSPMLGGWRNVLILYGLLGSLLTIPWIFMRTEPDITPQQSASPSKSIRHTISHVTQNKNIWLISFVYFGIGGGVQGVLGYLPLHLRGLGWTPITADGALSGFHLISLIFVIPIALWSDKLGARKRALAITGIMTFTGIFLISVTEGSLVWVGILMAGMVRDGFMTILLTMIVETKGIGHQYAGTATGFVLAIGAISSFLAPPIGNSLASVWVGAPFLFWSILSMLGMLCLKFVSVNNDQAKNTIHGLVTQE